MLTINLPRAGAPYNNVGPVLEPVMSVPTPLTEMLGIDHPIMCAGMGRITGAELAGAVSEAGGIGTLGMIGLSPAGMREQIRKVKAITDKPYGVDLLLPQVIPHSLN